MTQFIAAIHASDATPRALALIEADLSPVGVTYIVRGVRVLGDDPISEINTLLASAPQYVGRTAVVTTGGQRAADALHAKGPSAVAVTLVDESTPRDQDAFDVSAQVLVDTFEMLFRAGVVSVPSPSEAATTAIHALYRSADLDNAAPDGDRNQDGDLDDPDEGADAVSIEQSGSAANTSTATIRSPMNAREASIAAADGSVRLGRIAAHTGEAAPPLGGDPSGALALALAVWYGEIRADDLPMTDQAEKVLDKRDRRNAARSA